MPGIREKAKSGKRCFMTAAEIRAKIASGEIKRNSGIGAGPGAGIFGVQFDSAEFAPGESGNLRGKIVCRVIDAANPSDVGKKFNYFIQTVHSGYLESTLAEFTEYAKAWGISEDRIYDRADDIVDIVGNLMVEIQRLAIKGRLLGIIERKDSGKMNAKGKPMYWNNITEVSLNGAAPATAPSVTASVAPAAAAVAAPVAPVAPVAPLVTPASPAVAPVATNLKPWKK
jgi:hypothetical protein